jgi:hypothetical protein
MSDAEKPKLSQRIGLKVEMEKLLSHFWGKL